MVEGFGSRRRRSWVVNLSPFRLHTILLQIDGQPLGKGIQPLRSILLRVRRGSPNPEP